MSEHTPCIICGGGAFAFLNAYPQFNVCVADFLTLGVDPLVVEYAAYLAGEPAEPASFEEWRAEKWNTKTP